MKGLRRKKAALTTAFAVALVVTLLTMAVVYAPEEFDQGEDYYWGDQADEGISLTQTAYEMPWWERLLSLLEPLIGAQAIGLLVAFVYAVLGKWGNHQAWEWAKFEKTLIVAIINGFIYTGLQVLTGWSWADIELWVTEISGLYLMQKLIKGVEPYFSQLFGRLSGAAS